MEIQVIQRKIHEIRGRRVMLDFDLASLYQVQTKALKQAVKRNVQRFPIDFMFQLTTEEWEELVTNCDRLPATIKHSSVIPLAFTQEGVASLSGVLRSEAAVNVYISIMRAFVALRELAMTSIGIRQLAQENSEIRRLLDEFIEETEGKFDDVYVALSELALQRQIQSAKPRTKIGFKKE